MNKLRIIREGHILVTMKFKPPAEEKYSEAKGDLDLMIDAGNGKDNYFEITNLSTDEGFRQCLAKIDSISWHGFYFKSNEGIQMPLINFKERNQKKCHVRHTGFISFKDIFMFPICSIYAPREIVSYKFPTFKHNLKDQLLELSNKNSARVDIFTLPRYMKFPEYLNSFSHSAIELSSDITCFDKSINGAIYNLPIGKTEDMDLRFCYINDYCIISRTIYTSNTREGNMIDHFSILFHDPNSAIEMILDRKYQYPNMNDSKKFLLHDTYNIEKEEFHQKS